MMVEIDVGPPQEVGDSVEMRAIGLIGAKAGESEVGDEDAAVTDGEEGFDKPGIADLHGRAGIAVSNEMA